MGSDDGDDGNEGSRHKPGMGEFSGDVSGVLNGDILNKSSGKKSNSCRVTAVRNASSE